MSVIAPRIEVQRLADLGRLAPADYVDHPSGFLALSPRNQRFAVAGLPGFIAYRREGCHRIVVGGVHASRFCRAGLLEAFLRDSAGARERVVAVQVRQDQAALFRSQGFRVDVFGSSFALDLRRFAFAGTKRMKLRNRIKRGREAGLEVVELGRDRPFCMALWRKLQATSRAWLATKGGVELELLVGELGQPQDPQRRIFVALDRAGEPQAFITYVPAWGARPGYLHDLTRRAPAAPAGAIELINAVALARFQSEAVPFLHFGLTPFIVERATPGDHWLVPRLVRLIGRWGRAIYPARAQLQYKQKWAPDVIEPELIAFQKVSFGALWALLLVTRALVLPWRRARAAPAPTPQGEGGTES
jgi:lysylphosphatidylglycerol synthetase-like protein (DUF2156 family)